MKKYYYNDGTSQQGPFTLDELKEKNIKAETPVWYDGLPDWTTAGQLEELKGILVHTPPPFHATAVSPVEDVKPSAPVTTTARTATVAATSMATPAPPKSSKKSTAWLSYLLALLVIGAVGYLVYQDMEKNKGNSAGTNNTAMVTDSMANTTTQQSSEVPTTISAPVTNDTTGTAITSEPVTTANTVTNETVSSAPVTEEPATVTTTKTNTNAPSAKPDVATINAQKLALKKIEDNKKKLLAAQAAAALKEKEYRNNWPKYITVGQLNYNTKGDGVDAFNVPIINSTNATIDNVTVRVDYMKKEKKILKSETLVIANITPGTTAYGRAPEYKKGNNIKVIITNISSRKLHFCYPVNNGNPADPYFCK